MLNWFRRRLGFLTRLTLFSMVFGLLPSTRARAEGFTIVVYDNRGVRQCDAPIEEAGPYLAFMVGARDYAACLGLDYVWDPENRAFTLMRRRTYPTEVQFHLDRSQAWSNYGDNGWRTTWNLAHLGVSPYERYGYGANMMPLRFFNDLFDYRTVYDGGSTIRVHWLKPLPVTWDLVRIQSLIDSPSEHERLTFWRMGIPQQPPGGWNMMPSTVEWLRSGGGREVATDLQDAREKAPNGYFRADWVRGKLLVYDDAGDKVLIERTYWGRTRNASSITLWFHSNWAARQYLVRLQRKRNWWVLGGGTVSGGEAIGAGILILMSGPGAGVVAILAGASLITTAVGSFNAQGDVDVVEQCIEAAQWNAESSGSAFGVGIEIGWGGITCHDRFTHGW